MNVALCFYPVMGLRSSEVDSVCTGPATVYYPVITAAQSATHPHVDRHGGHKDHTARPVLDTVGLHVSRHREAFAAGCG